MVKGITKRVVVVRCPDTKYFDEAIFMVREEALEGVDPEHVLKEACRAADSYMRENGEKRERSWPWILGGIGAVALVFFVVVFL